MTVATPTPITSNELRWAESGTGPMPMPDEISLGEVARRLDRFERSVDQQFTGVHRQIESMQYVSRETYEARHKALSARVEELEDSKRWFSRGLVVSFVFPVLVAIVLALVLTK